MAQEFSISVDLAQLLELGPVVRAQVFANLSTAVESVAEAGVERWKMGVLNAKLWEGERRAYADTIRYEMKGKFSAEITSDYKFVEDIETGRPPYDQKRMLQTSTKVRTTKDGRRFLVIPLRHNVPGASGGMSEAAYGLAVNLKKTTIVSQGYRPAGEVTDMIPGKFMRPSASQRPYLSDPKTKSAYLVRKHNYAWGDRLTRKMLTQAGSSKSEAKRLDGLYRFNTSSGKQNSSSYLTFRIMMEGSKGWVIPARPGLWIARAVAESLQRTADIDFPAAVAADLAAA